MDIVHVRSHKKAWLPLLLVGDESEAMIDRYLERGALFVLHDPDARGLCVVTRESEGLAQTRLRQGADRICLCALCLVLP